MVHSAVLVQMLLLCTTFSSQLIALFIEIKYLVMKEHKVVIPDWELKKYFFFMLFLNQDISPKNVF